MTSYFAEFLGFDFNEFDEGKERSDAIPIRLSLGQNHSEAKNLYNALENYFDMCESNDHYAEVCSIDEHIANANGYLDYSVINNLVTGETTHFVPGTLEFTSESNGEDTLNSIREQKIEARSIKHLNVIDDFYYPEQVIGDREDVIEHVFLQAEDEDGLIYHIARKDPKRSKIAGKPIWILFHKFLDDEQNYAGTANAWCNIESNGNFIYSSKTEFDSIYRGWSNWKKVTIAVYDNDIFITSYEKYFQLGSCRNLDLFKENFAKFASPWLKSVVRKYDSNKFTFNIEVFIRTIPYKKIKSKSNRNFRTFSEEKNKKLFPRKKDSVVTSNAGAFTHDEFMKSRTKCSLEYTKYFDIINTTYDEIVNF